MALSSNSVRLIPFHKANVSASTMEDFDERSIGKDMWFLRAQHA